MAIVSSGIIYGLIQIKNIDLNNSNTDILVTIPYKRYIPRRITVTNASISLASSPATLGLFTAPNGGGITIVPLSTLTSINSITRFVDLVFSFTSFSTLSTVYFRNGVAHGSPATVDAYIEVLVLP